ncbi:MAG: AAA-like domain-containing protein [Phormidesmis sp.]
MNKAPVRRILILAANPQGTGKLRLDAEVREIQEGLKRSAGRDRFQVISQWAVQTDDLRRALLEYEPHIVHFCGHGEGDQGLVLDDGQGRAKQVSDRALSRLFKQFPTLECVLLNACYSDVQAQALVTHVPYVIGMHQVVGETAAIKFATGFYDALGYDRTYPEAYEFGLSAIDLEDIPEVHTPVLQIKGHTAVQPHPQQSQQSQQISQASSHQANQPARQSETAEQAPEPKRIFISYRDQSPDTDLAQQFFQTLRAEGHLPFMAGESIELGEPWAKRISAELDQCDYMLLLLSPQSATSEMVTEEVRRAKRLRDQCDNNRPAILPIRINLPLDDPLNYDLRGYLQQIQQREWTSPADTEQLLLDVKQLIANDTSHQAAFTPPQSNPQTNPQTNQQSNLEPHRHISLADPAYPLSPISAAIADSLEHPPLPVAEPELKREPGGSVPLKSGLYVARSPIETDCFEEIMQPGSLIRIKAPRQMGKTSLMARTLNHAREQGCQAIPLSFQRADHDVFSDLNKLLRWFCEQIGRRLKKLKELEDYWTGDYGVKDKCNAYFEECLLPDLEAPLVLGLDEVDSVVPHREIADSFFSLVRSWYESARYGDFSSELWESLRLVIVHSTEVYVPLNINQSPFNVGKNVELPEFTFEQVSDLAQRYNLSGTANQVEQLMTLVGGHPYLVRKALYHLRREDILLNELSETAHTEGGIYGDHLRRHLLNLQVYPQLAAALRQVVQKDRGVDIDAQSAFKLESMGLVSLQGNAALPRCDVYRQYFKDHLE